MKKYLPIFFLENKYMLLILTLAFIIRFFFVGLNPVGITHDEIHDLINAKSMALTGQGAPGTVAGIFTREGYCDSNCVFGELVSFILVPWMVISPLGMTWPKIPFVLASVGIVFFTGKIFERLSGKKSIGLIAAILMAINPWAIHFGRSAYENLFTYLFYLWGIYYFVKKDGSFKHLFTGLLISLLGFLSYFGAKPLFPFLIILGAIYNTYLNKFKNIKTAALISLLGIAITVGYLLILNNSEAGLRLKELNADNSQIIAQEVDEQRQVMLPTPFKSLVINKYTVQLKAMTEVYLGAFSPNYLFVKGENSLDVFMISNHPYFFLIDIPFLLLGVLALAAVPFAGFFLFSTIALQPLPSVVSAIHITYALRAGLMFPLITGIIAMGIYYLVNLFKQKKLKYVAIGIITIIYIFSFLNFAILYWYKTPFEKNVAWFAQERMLSKYLKLAEENKTQNFLVISKAPLDLAYELVYFNDMYNSAPKIKDVNEKFKSKNLQFNNIKLSSSCFDLINLPNAENTTIIIEQGVDCKDLKPKTPPVKIPNTRDAGELFVIYNDILCRGETLQRYPYPQSITDFNVEKQSKSEFCTKWITNTN